MASHNARESAPTCSSCPVVARGVVQVEMMEVCSSTLFRCTSGTANPRRAVVEVQSAVALLRRVGDPDALVVTSVEALNVAFMAWRNERARIQELGAWWVRLSSRDISPGAAACGTADHASPDRSTALAYRDRVDAARHSCARARPLER